MHGPLVKFTNFNYITFRQDIRGRHSTFKLYVKGFTDLDSLFNTADVVVADYSHVVDSVVVERVRDVGGAPSRWIARYIRHLCIAVVKVPGTRVVRSYYSKVLQNYHMI